MLQTDIFSPATLDAVKTIICHDNCADGTASAILLKDAFYGKDVNTRFIQYGTEAHKNLQPEPGMLFCDFSPVPERAQEFVDAGAIVLDHHKTARPVVEMFDMHGVFGDEVTEPGVCGAVLAFRHVWVPRRGQLAIQKAWAAGFATLAGIRDTWQKHDSRWRDACIQGNVLHFLSNDRWLARSLTEIASSWDREFRPTGEILWDKHQKGIAKTLKGAYHFTTQKGTRVVAFDSLLSSSDAAEALGDEADLVVGFATMTDNGAPQYIFSSRSHTGYDCSAFAKQHGGGGHTAAAGFSIKFDPTTALNAFGFLKALVEAHEDQP